MAPDSFHSIATKELLAGKITTQNTSISSYKFMSITNINNDERLSMHYDSSIGIDIRSRDNVSILFIDEDKAVGISTGASIDNSSKLQIESTTQGFLPPRMTTTQKGEIGTPATGLMVYDTTLNKLCVYTGSAWETITST
jgi:hypothetical protein